MKQSLLQEKYPIYVLEVEKSETPYRDLDEVIGYLKARIDAHKVAVFIADFDHLAHTRSLAEGEIGPGIIAARNIVFCFGIKLPKPEMLSVRPRSIGVAEYVDKFVVSFLEAPMPVANEAMETWVLGIAGK
ncbi:MAG: hypothetical protein KJ558_02715 [Gammaproteobacteria bacterium]|nr:hypothetical protein [Gammaproteobacteria bacterium]MBU1653738.1 hypothetical protein [Gammaproteobacteria bacterium]MBU1959615.1 hypothetical protein [Gammaproteobacteria bacterium]